MPIIKAKEITLDTEVWVAFAAGDEPIKYKTREIDRRADINLIFWVGEDEDGNIARESWHEQQPLRVDKWPVQF